MADYPDNLIFAAQEAPSGPWMYTGALENRPDVVAKIDRVLWGNSAAVLKKVRSPRLVYECLTRRHLPCPEIAEADPDPRRRWLLKPRRSAGGQGIHPWQPGTSFDAKRCFLQEWIDGDSHAAIFLGQSGGPTLLLGMTRQLIGEPCLHAAPFQYCGSVGPVELPAATQATLTRIGNALVDEFALRGLFGVDFILQDQTPWPVEVNPRYTASVEVLERATGQPLLKLHAGACAGHATAEFVPAAAHNEGKFIVYARKPLTFPAHGPWEQEHRLALDDPSRRFGDVPGPGESITAGQPIFTLFGTIQDVQSRVDAFEELSRSSMK